MTRPILYISGPYSSGNGRTVTHNIQIAQEYAAIAWMKGWAAFCPHLNTANFERYCPTVEHSDWLAGDLAILDRLRPGHDAILMLPNWQQSPGARREREAAQLLGLIVYYADAIAGGVPEVPE